MNRYVVVGQMGEYSDREVWGVRVFDAQTEAQAFVDRLSAETREMLQRVKVLNEEWPEDQWEQLEAMRCSLDPKVTGQDLDCHYDGVSYSLWELPCESEPPGLFVEGT